METMKRKVYLPFKYCEDCKAKDISTDMVGCGTDFSVAKTCSHYDICIKAEEARKKYILFNEE